jgi:hypothetical protein
MKRAIALLCTIAALCALVLVPAGCGDTDAKVASHNLSKAAEQFEVPRRIVFYNGITDKYMLTIEGFCSIEYDGEDVQLEVTCKDGDHSFKKDYLGLSDNVTYVVEQLKDVDVSTTQYRVIFKPESIVPDFDRP